MPGETERVGGIGVGVSIDESQVEAQLAALLAKMRQYGEKMSAAVSPTVTIGNRVSGGAGASSGPASGSGPSHVALDTGKLEAKFDELIAAMGKFTAAGGVSAREVRQRRIEANTVSIQGGGRAQTFGQLGDVLAQKSTSTSGRANSGDFLRQQLRDALGNDPIEVPVEADEGGLREVAEHVDRLRVDTEKPIVLNIDGSEIRAVTDQVAALAAEVHALVEQMRQIPAAAAGGGGRRPRSAAPAASFAGASMVEGPPGGEQGPASAATAPLRDPNAPRPQQAGTRRSNFTQEQADRQRAREAANTPPPESPPGGSRRRSPEERAAQAARGDEEQRTLAAFAASARVRQFELDETAAARTVASRRASITGSGRTSRTLASGVSALFGGTEGRQIEAQVTAQQAARQLRDAERAIEPLDNRLREIAHSWSASSGEARRFNREQFLGIRRSEEYRAALGNVRTALEEDADSQEELAKISSGGNIVRNLAAITAGGLAFGVGLKLVDTVLGAAGNSLGRYADEVSGFGATSTRVTTELGKQTLAMHGNADAALALAEAQAGISASGSDALTTQLRLTTQIKAGALAQEQASELFRAGRGVGNAPSGLFGGFGGVGGTGLLAQQLGGGRGFTEQVASDVGAFKGGGGQDLLGNLNYALAYISNTGARDTVNDQARSQGSPLAGASDFVGGLGDFISSLNPLGQNSLQAFSKNSSGVPHGEAPSGASEAAGPPSETVAYLNDLNQAAERGKTALGAAAQATYKYTTSAEEVARGTAAAAAAGDVYGVSLAQQHGLVVELNGAVADSAEAYRKAIEQFAVGRGIQDPDQIGRAALAAERQRQIESRASVPALQSQQEFARPSILNAIQRQFQRQLTQENPAQAALGALSNPLTAPGTGISGRNAAEQAKINAGIQDSIKLQDTLNSYYAQGRQILMQTYQIPQALMASLSGVSSEIAGIQQGLSNRQAAYQTAQFNYQLHIAQRTLGDIAGLTGHAFGVPATELGTLERANLLLSRQAQTLQFILAQRQINFQTALAGFTVPGLTPAEQNARVRENKVSADFAQKQLDIQREMFRNQVKIVDIGNLRQGVDLANQISLMLKGRALEIDTKIAQDKLERLSRKQQALLADAQAYIQKANAQISAREAEITALEAATGGAISRLQRQGVDAAYAVGHAFFLGITGGFLGDQGGGGAGGDRKAPQGPKVNASGALFSTQGTTSLGPYGVAGEAGDETVAILRNPRRFEGTMGGGGGDVYVTFGDVTVRSATDIDDIVRKVTQAQGRTASLKGLRSPN